MERTRRQKHQPNKSQEKKKMFFTDIDFTMTSDIFES